MARKQQVSDYDEATRVLIAEAAEEYARSKELRAEAAELMRSLKVKLYKLRAQKVGSYLIERETGLPHEDVLHMTPDFRR